MQNDLSKRDAKNASIAFLLTQSTSQGPYCTANLQVSLPDFANKYTECRVYDSENVHWASAKLTFLLFFCACSTRVSTAWDGGGCQSRDLGWGACSGVSLSERSFLTSTYHHLANEKKKKIRISPSIKIYSSHKAENLCSYCHTTKNLKYCVPQRRSPIIIWRQMFSRDSSINNRSIDSFSELFRVVLLGNSKAAIRSH